MRFFYAQDARNNRPTRKGMGPLIAVGGVSVPTEVLGRVEKSVEDLSSHFGFPRGEAFQWQPPEDQWMHSHLKGNEKTHFFIQQLDLMERFGVRVLVVMEDTNLGLATKTAPDAEADVLSLFLERIQKHFSKDQTDGVMVIDRPSANAQKERRFLCEYVDQLQNSASYTKPHRFASNILSVPMKQSRLLQIAEIVTSCTVAIVGGEIEFSTPVFSKIKNLFLKDTGRIGGVGLKIHPDLRYSNLYHWLVGDAFLIRVAKNAGIPLPSSKYPYYHSLDL